MLKKPRLILIVFLVTLLFSTALIAESNDLGLNQIIELALEENLDLEMANLNLEDARIDHSKNQLNNLISNSRLFELQSELQLLQAEENYNSVRNSVILNIIDSYIKIVKSDQEILSAEKELALEARKIEEVKAQVEVGYKGTLELFEQETKHLAASNSLERIKYQREQQLRELKQKIGKENIAIEFIDLVIPQIWEVTEDEVLAVAIENNTSIEIRDKQLNLAKSDLERAKVSGTAELELKQKKIAFDRAELNLIQEKQGFENSLKNIHFQYNQAVNNLEMTKKFLSQSRNNFDIIKEQFEAGLVSRNDMLSSELQVYYSENNLISSIISYYTSVLQLQEAMGLELEVNIEDGEKVK